jgi:ricin-type beta-trefoil lectin protein
VRVGRWLGIFAVLFIMTSTGQPGAQAAPPGGTTIGPVQISALGHPSLCWEAGGNGSGVTLEHCDRVLQGQQWSLTPNGVLMNGNGYCLEAIPGHPLFIDFAAQCDGATSQLWHYHSAHLTSPVPAAGTCAATAGPLVPGAEIVGSACSPSALAAGAVSRWSIGYSAVTVAPGRGHGPVGGTFGASVTVANAPSAQAAYGVSVAFTLPPGVSASTLRAAPGPSSPGSTSSRSGPHTPGPPAPGPSGSGLRCDVSTLTCTGTLPAGASRQITLTGPVPAAIRPGDSYPIRVHASVTGTTQRSRTARTTAALTVTVAPAAPQPRSPLPLIATGAAILLLGGFLLILLTRSPSRIISSSPHRTPSRHRASAAPHPTTPNSMSDLLRLDAVQSHIHGIENGPDGHRGRP